MAQDFAVTRDGNVCSIMNIRGFGETQPMGYSHKDGYGDYVRPFTNLAGFLEAVQKRVEHYNNVERDYNHFQQMGLVRVVLISKQPKAIELMREFGGWVEVSSGMGKFDHEVIQFTMPAKDFIERFNNHAIRLKVKPRL